MQGTTTLRKQLSSWTKVPEEKLKFEAHDVGGGFGQRTLAYPEYCALMIAAKASGRPVKWISSRMEGFLADSHGRGNIITGELALDRDGKFLAMRLDWINDMGAYLSPGAMGHIRNTTTCMTGVYRIPALHGTYRVALTNTTPVAAYRGAGRPDIAYVVERLVSQAAAELNVDAAELRRRNFILPEGFPYRTPTGSVYENADLPGLLQKALKLAESAGTVCGGGQAARHRHFDRHREHRRRQRTERRDRVTARCDRHDHRVYRLQGAGSWPRNDTRDDRRRCPRRAARASKSGAMRVRFTAGRQSHRRLAHDSRGRQRVFPCGAKTARGRQGARRAGAQA
jgi:CO/xanthine dehydrogenase Mo-binding subunit